MAEFVFPPLTEFEGSAGDVSFINRPGDDPAVERNVQDRLRDSVHLLDYVPVEHHQAIFDGTLTTAVYDCSDAMDAAIASITVNDPGANNVGGPEILLPYGTIPCGRTIQLKKTVSFKGHGTGQQGGFSTILQFDADLTGIFVNRYNTLGDEIISPVTRGADSSMFRDFRITSLGGTLGHGIHCRARCFVQNVYIDSFPQNGLHVVASEVVGPELGNADNSHFSNMRILGCGGNGVLVRGGTANACVFDHIDCTQNLGCGVFEESYLGNTWIMPHVSTNGTNGHCSYNPGSGFKRYQTENPDLAHLFAPESIDTWTSGVIYIVDDYVENSVSGAVKTYKCLVSPGTPSTSAPNHLTGEPVEPDGYQWQFAGEQVWVFYDDGGVHPQWPAWNGSLTYVYGNPFRATSDNSICGVVVGLYVEGGYGASHFVTPWITIGTQVEYTPHSTAFRIGATTSHGQITPFEMPSQLGGPVEWTMYFNSVDDEAIRVSADGDHSNGFQVLQWDETNSAWCTGWARSQKPVRYTTSLSTGITCGRSAAIGGGQIVFGQGFWVGESVANARKITNDGAAPTTGIWAAGDLVFNQAPLIGEPWGWRCILAGDFAGTPPVFQPLRDTGSQQTISGIAFTLTPGSSVHRTLHSGTMTADRAATLSTTGALAGLSYKISRTSAGAFNLNVLNGSAGPTIKALAVNTWGEFTFDGTNWYVSAYGAL